MFNLYHPPANVDSTIPCSAANFLAKGLANTRSPCACCTGTDAVVGGEELSPVVVVVVGVGAAVAAAGTSPNSY